MVLQVFDSCTPTESDSLPSAWDKGTTMKRRVSIMSKVFKSYVLLVTARLKCHFVIPFDLTVKPEPLEVETR